MPSFQPAILGVTGQAGWKARFESVEVNVTLYRLPTETMIFAWNRKLGPNFHLVVKGSRVVTHLKKIADCQGPLQGFLDSALRLERPHTNSRFNKWYCRWALLGGFRSAVRLCRP